ncbi:hypothetical protein ACVRXQ_10630 [Streptococcus panodentis]|uniref:Uncharacterized protein n=1 Tax=Streptococcus panodentis TaxID=1581472 RepID=A0ABS5AXS0_9STRE|nr:hypothetical protein [Streptococcus panodentis]MBP2621369.1 hypothetical protein [Streptococcus panodentis]
MEKFTNIFKSLDRSWLIRHYLFSFAFFALLVYLTVSNPRPSYPALFLFLLFSLFYPFAMFVYESIVKLVMGDSIFLIPILVILIWKIVRFFMIWLFSLPIGIIGLIYLYFAVNRKTD